MKKDYYDILGVQSNSSKDDIKRAYRILAHQYHPDKNNGNEKRFKEINEAYRILSDDKSRAQYDSEIKSNPYSNTDQASQTTIKKEPVSKFSHWLVFIGIFIVIILLTTSFTKKSNSPNLAALESNGLYYLPNGSVYAYFPEQPVFKTSTQKLLTNGENVTDNVYSLNNTTTNPLSITYVSSAFNNNDTPENNLKNEVAYTSGGVVDPGVSLTSSNATTYAGFPARDYTMVNQHNWCATGRDILRNKDLYMVEYYYKCGDKDPVLENKFLNSLSFNNSPTQNDTVVNQPPDKVGQCQKTTVTKISTRLTDGATEQPIYGSGSYIEYADGIHQVSYDTVQGIENSQIGDEVLVCLISVPTDCPAGDNRGSNYTATNLRTGEAWRAQDSEHSCGGA